MDASTSVSAVSREDHAVARRAALAFVAWIRGSEESKEDMDEADEPTMSNPVASSSSSSSSDVLQNRRSSAERHVSSIFSESCLAKLVALIAFGGQLARRGNDSVRRVCTRVAMEAVARELYGGGHNRRSTLPSSSSSSSLLASLRKSDAEWVKQRARVLEAVVLPGVFPELSCGISSPSCGLENAGLDSPNSSQGDSQRLLPPLESLEAYGAFLASLVQSWVSRDAADPTCTTVPSLLERVVNRLFGFGNIADHCVFASVGTAGDAVCTAAVNVMGMPPSLLFRWLAAISGEEANEGPNGLAYALVAAREGDSTGVGSPRGLLDAVLPPITAATIQPWRELSVSELRQRLCGVLAAQPVVVEDSSRDDAAAALRATSRMTRPGADCFSPWCVSTSSASSALFHECLGVGSSVTAEGGACMLSERYLSSGPTPQAETSLGIEVPVSERKRMVWHPLLDPSVRMADVFKVAASWQVASQAARYQLLWQVEVALRRVGDEAPPFPLAAAGATSPVHNESLWSAMEGKNEQYLERVAAANREQLRQALAATIQAGLYRFLSSAFGSSSSSSSSGSRPNEATRDQWMASFGNPRVDVRCLTQFLSVLSAGSLVVSPLTSPKNDGRDEGNNSNHDFASVGGSRSRAGVGPSPLAPPLSSLSPSLTTNGGHTRFSDPAWIAFLLRYESAMLLSQDPSGRLALEAALHSAGFLAAGLGHKEASRTSAMCLSESEFASLADDDVLLAELQDVLLPQPEATEVVGLERVGQPLVAVPFHVSSDPTSKDMRGTSLRRAHQRRLGLSTLQMLVVANMWKLYLSISPPPSASTDMTSTLAQQAAQQVLRACHTMLEARMHRFPGGGGLHQNALIQSAHHHATLVTSKFAMHRAELIVALERLRTAPVRARASAVGIAAADNAKNDRSSSVGEDDDEKSWRQRCVSLLAAYHLSGGSSALRGPALPETLPTEQPREQLDGPTRSEGATLARLHADPAAGLSLGSAACDDNIPREHDRSATFTAQAAALRLRDSIRFASPGTSVLEYSAATVNSVSVLQLQRVSHCAASSKAERFLKRIDCIAKRLGEQRDTIPRRRASAARVVMEATERMASLPLSVGIVLSAVHVPPKYAARFHGVQQHGAAATTAVTATTTGGGATTAAAGLPVALTRAAVTTGISVPAVNAAAAAVSAANAAATALSAAAGPLAALLPVIGSVRGESTSAAVTAREPPAPYSLTVAHERVSAATAVLAEGADAATSLLALVAAQLETASAEFAAEPARYFSFETAAAQDAAMEKQFLRREIGALRERLLNDRLPAFCRGEAVLESASLEKAVLAVEPVKGADRPSSDHNLLLPSSSSAPKSRLLEIASQMEAYEATLRETARHRQTLEQASQLRQRAIPLKADVLAHRAALLSGMERVREQAVERVNHVKHTLELRLQREKDDADEEIRVRRQSCVQQRQALEESVQQLQQTQRDRRAEDEFRRRIATLENEVHVLEALHARVTREQELFSQALIGNWDASHTPLSSRSDSRRPVVRARRFHPVCWLTQNSEAGSTPRSAPSTILLPNEWHICGVLEDTPPAAPRNGATAAAPVTAASSPLVSEELSECTVTTKMWVDSRATFAPKAFTYRVEASQRK